MVLKTTAAIDVGLVLLVKLLDKWLDYSDFKFSLNTNKIKDIRLFMNEASKLERSLVSLPNRLPHSHRKSTSSPLTGGNSWRQSQDGPWLTTRP